MSAKYVCVENSTGCVFGVFDSRADADAWMTKQHKPNDYVPRVLFAVETVLSPDSPAPAVADNNGGQSTQFDVVYVCGNDECSKPLPNGGCYCSARCAEIG